MDLAPPAPPLAPLPRRRPAPPPSAAPGRGRSEVISRRAALLYSRPTIESRAVCREMISPLSPSGTERASAACQQPSPPSYSCVRHARAPFLAAFCHPLHRPSVVAPDLRSRLQRPGPGGLHREDPIVGRSASHCARVRGPGWRGGRRAHRLWFGRPSGAGRRRRRTCRPAPPPASATAGSASPGRTTRTAGRRPSPAAPPRSAMGQTSRGGRSSNLQG